MWVTDGEEDTLQEVLINDPFQQEFTCLNAAKLIEKYEWQVMGKEDISNEEVDVNIFERKPTEKVLRKKRRPLSSVDSESEKRNRRTKRGKYEALYYMYYSTKKEETAAKKKASKASFSFHCYFFSRIFRVKNPENLRKLEMGLNPRNSGYKNPKKKFDFGIN